MGEIAAGCSEERVYIKVRGKGDFQNSQPLKKFFLDTISQGFKNFIVDLDECTGMDSTFVGMVAGMASFLREQSSPTVKLVHVSKANYEMLDTLGMTKILDISSDDVKFEFPLSLLTTDRGTKLETTEHIIESHAHLIKLSGNNLRRFQKVQLWLRKDLRRQKEERKNKD